MWCALRRGVVAWWRSGEAVAVVPSIRAVAAEAGKSANGVAQLSAQQLRSVEVGAKLAGVGGYAPARATPEGGGATFSVTINLGDQSRSITVAVPRQADEVETVTVDDAE